MARTTEIGAVFNQLDTQYGNMFCSMELKWLNCGVVLRQLFEQLEETDFFTSSRGKSEPQLTSKDWLRDLTFLVDIIISKHAGYFSAKAFTSGDTNV